MGRHHPQIQSRPDLKNCRSGLCLSHLRYVTFYSLLALLVKFQLQVEQQSDELEVAEVVFEEEEEVVGVVGAQVGLARNIKTEPQTDSLSVGQG